MDKWREPSKVRIIMSTTYKIFWVSFCSTQKCVNCDNIYFALKQPKSRQDNIYCKFVMWSRYGAISQCSTWQIAPHYKQFCHVVQNCLPNAMWRKIAPHEFFAPQTMSVASATIIMYDISVTTNFCTKVFSQEALWPDSCSLEPTSGCHRWRRCWREPQRRGIVWSSFPNLLLAPQSNALRRGAYRDSQPIPYPSTYSFWAFKPVYTKTFRPVSGSMWQSMVKL